MQPNEDLIDPIRHRSRFVSMSIQTKIHGAAKDLPTDTEHQPQTWETALIIWLRIRERDRRFRHPEDAGAETAARCAEEHEPFATPAVVAVEASGEGAVACGAEDQRPTDSEEFDEDARERTGQDHAAEGQGVGCVDEPGRSPSGLLYILLCSSMDRRLTMDSAPRLLREHS